MNPNYLGISMTVIYVAILICILAIISVIYERGNNTQGIATSSREIKASSIRIGNQTHVLKANGPNSKITAVPIDQADDSTLWKTPTSYYYESTKYPGLYISVLEGNIITSTLNDNPNNSWALERYATGSAFYNALSKKYIVISGSDTFASNLPYPLYLYVS